MVNGNYRTLHISCSGGKEHPKMPMRELGLKFFFPSKRAPRLGARGLGDLGTQKLNATQIKHNR